MDWKRVASYFLEAVYDDVVNWECLDRENGVLDRRCAEERFNRILRIFESGDERLILNTLKNEAGFVFDVRSLYYKDRRGFRDAVEYVTSNLRKIMNNVRSYYVDFDKLARYFDDAFDNYLREVQETCENDMGCIRSELDDVSNFFKTARNKDILEWISMYGSIPDDELRYVDVNALSELRRYAIHRTERW